MKVLLVSPPYDIAAYMGKLSRVAFVFPPMGLLYIAASLRQNGIESKVYDFSVANDDFFELVKTYQPDVIGISCQTALVYSSIELCKRIKEQFPFITTVVGGVHVNLRPIDLLSSPFVDYCAQGEGEITIVELVRALEEARDASEVPGVITMKNSAPYFAPPRMPVENIDNYPPPALDLIDFDKYQVSPDLRLGDRVGVLFTSRGCPFDCIFCCNRMLTEGKWRGHSVSRVFEEIDALIHRYHVDNLFFFDDNFCVNRKHTKEICREYIRKGYHQSVPWWAEARIDCVDEETLQLMYDAGCRILSFGLESGNQRILDMIQKNITLEEVRRVVAMTSRIGISVRASFILGFPTESREETLRTISFANSIDVDQVRFAIATPFPGTKLWDIAVSEGRIDPEHIDWLRFSLMSGYADREPIYAPKGREPRELAELQRRANFNFYFKPKTIFMYLRRIKSVAMFKQMVAGFFVLLHSRFRRR